MSRPVLLDLFCGAGGAAMGYHRAGFDVVGVDIKPQPRYPFAFHQADALTFPLDGFDAIHASPPCQAYSHLRVLPWMRDRDYWDSIPPTMALLRSQTLPWVVENVDSAQSMAALGDTIRLCGTEFGLAWEDGVPLYRHRLFASSFTINVPEHRPHKRGAMTSGRDNMAASGRFVTGNRSVRLNNGRVIGGHQAANIDNPIGVPWMRGNEAAQAIPPAYTEYIGRQLIERL